ncbi:MAG: succinate dehydrogenase, hydrophobic membrane anchor protein [Pseudomonadota bacterium]
MSHYHISGLGAWLVQRLSAVYMGLFVVVVAIILLITPEIDYIRWRGLFTQPVLAIATTMFFLALLLHAWVGMRDVILDYAGPSPSMRLLILSLLGGWLIALGIWEIRIMMMVMV